jgi:hypothetical protein
MVRTERIRKIGLCLMSVFIIWHVVAMAFVGPSHNHYLRSNLMSIYKNYLNVLNLNGPWPFYAPNPSFGSIMRYETISASGEIKIYPLTEAHNKFDHAYVRNINFYVYFYRNAAKTKKRGYDKSVARYLCAQHAGTDVKEIIFRRYRQKRFTFQNYQQGKKPLDDEFLKHTVHGPYPCTGT